jgi:hypothetical protein
MSKGSKSRVDDIERFQANYDQIDWSDQEERAAILEYDGELSREEAEKIAGLHEKNSTNLQ